MDARRIVVDGIEYAPVIQMGDIKIVVLNCGFIYVGRVEIVNAEMIIRGARNIIRWETTRHLGELVNGPLEKTKLGDSCVVKCFLSQVIYTIEVNQNEWNKHIS